jgi:hypothetical protein
MQDGELLDVVEYQRVSLTALAEFENRIDAISWADARKSAQGETHSGLCLH